MKAGFGLWASGEFEDGVKLEGRGGDSFQKEGGQ